MVRSQLQAVVIITVFFIFLGGQSDQLVKLENDNAVLFTPVCASSLACLLTAHQT